jgi:lysophospholipase L1-like esterase
LRLFRSPVDYLQPVLTPDPELRWRIEPLSSGHDVWGFRNRAVPSQADIVAIGDSQTYGINATLGETWPSILARLRGARVYQLALGGYGPVEYEKLLRKHALALRPHVVIVGLYLGNDLFDAAIPFRLQTGRIKPQDLVARVEERARPLGRWRTWMSRHSMFYRMALAVCGDVLRKSEMRIRTVDRACVLVRDRGGRIVTGLTPELRQAALDTEDEAVINGIETTASCLVRMHKGCTQNGIRFLVVLIPTKESVYAGTEGSDAATVVRVAELELEAKRRLMALLGPAGIDVVDVLPALRSEVRSGRHPYPPNLDGHPNAPGYEAVARVVAEALAAPERTP